MSNSRAYRAPRLNIEVTAEVIERAIRKDSSHCMIAEAIAEAIPYASYISVDLATIRYTDEAAGWRYIYLTPGPAQYALLAFDAGEPVEPFKIRQNAAQKVLTGSAKRRRLAERAETGESREDARLESPRDGEIEDRAVPVKVGGRALPRGPLAATIPSENTRARKGHRGKRREFGLRRFVR